MDGAYELADGGRWVDGRYVYVDILGGRLFETPGAGSLYWRTPTARPCTSPTRPSARSAAPLARYGVRNPAAASGAVLSLPVPAGGTAVCSWRAGE